VNRIRIGLTILILASTLSLSAQSHEAGLFVSLPKFDSTPIVFNDGPLDVRGEYEEDLGYGISYNRYFSNRFSTEFAAQRLSADANIIIDDGTTETSTNLGSFDLLVLTGVAQWHFARGSRLSPYIGAGVSHITGEVTSSTDEGLNPDGPQSQDIESETSILANAGLNIRVTPSVALALDAKYLPYEAKVEGDQNQADTLDPFVWSAGVKFRF
jgi:outer membrane autotransporter protein